MCITWTRKNFHFLLDKEVFVLSINKVVEYKIFQEKSRKKIFFLFWHKTGKPIIVKLCCLNESNRDFIIIVTDFNEMTENFPTFSTLQNGSTSMCNFFFLDKLRKFTISDFPKQTHFRHILITLFFFHPLIDPHCDIVFQPIAWASAASTKTL